MRHVELLTRTCTFLFGLFLAPCLAEDRSAQLVRDLGHWRWSRRETAQIELLEQGVTSGLLEMAARSSNPELAYRARYVLSRLDPGQAQCQIIKVVLTPEPMVAAIAQAVGQEGEELLARPLGPTSPQAAASGGYPESPSYTLRYRSLQADPNAEAAVSTEDATQPASASALFEVTVTQQSAPQSQGLGTLEIPPSILGSNALGLLRVGDQSLHTRTGNHLSRKRHPFVTLVRLKLGRKSQIGNISLPSNPVEACAELGKELARACSHPQATQRHAALEALSWLRSPYATAALESVLVSSQTSAEEKALACLGLDRVDSLRLLLATAVPGDETAVRDATSTAQRGWVDEVPDVLRARAAARSLEKGDEAGLGAALERVAEGNTNGLHDLMSAIADFASSGKASPAARESIVSAAFSEDFLGHILWQDAESEYYLLVAAGLIGSEDTATTTRALGAIASLARGELGPVNTSLRPLVGVWRSLQSRLDSAPAEELQLWLSVLPTLKDPTQLLEAVSFLESVLTEQCLASPPGLKNLELENLLSALTALQSNGDAQGFIATVQALTRITRVLCLRPGQLRTVVTALVEAGELGLAVEPGASAQVSGYLRQLEAELQKWTSVDGAKRKTGGEIFNKDSWRAWLADAEAVAAREQAIVEGGGSLSPPQVKRTAAQPTPGAPTRPVVYYELEFELLNAATVTDGVEPYRLLDARRVELAASRQSMVVDRWGQRLSIRVEDDVNPGKQSLPRFRVNSRTYLFAGVPSLSTVQSRTLSSTWHETSDSWFGSRILPGSGSSTYRSLYLVDYLDVDPGPPPAQDPETIWRWLVEKRLLVPPVNATREHWIGLLGVLRTLRLRSSTPILRQELERQPATEIAQLLLELGDSAGEEYLGRVLAEGKTPQERFQAALALTESGSGAGAAALVSLAESNTPQLGAQGYRIAGALEAFLDKTPTASPVRTRVLGLIVSKLEDLTYQHRGFAILEREAGKSFGFTAAQFLGQPQERQEGIARALASARAWWAQR